jgi:adenine-specific DNA methylase
MIRDILNNQTITDFETEIIDGKQTTIVEYDIPLIGENLMTMKIWIWNEKGVPLKAYMTMTMEEITMTMDFVFSNYSFSDIPDRTFNVT